MLDTPTGRGVDDVQGVSAGSITKGDNKPEQIRIGAERKDSGQIFLVTTRHTHLRKTCKSRDWRLQLTPARSKHKFVTD